MRRILAVDFGDRRTGLAASDYTGTIIVPLEPIVGLTERDCAQEIASIAADRDSEVIVIGMPLDRRGLIGPRAERTQRFVALVRAAAKDREVATVDETSTTDEAHQRLKEGGLKAARRKKLADSVAAIVILERYVAASS